MHVQFMFIKALICSKSKQPLTQPSYIHMHVHVGVTMVTQFAQIML